METFSNQFLNESIENSNQFLNESIEIKNLKFNSSSIDLLRLTKRDDQHFVVTVKSERPFRLQIFDREKNRSTQSVFVGGADHEKITQLSY